MSPLIGFDEEVAAEAKAWVGCRDRLSDAMNDNLLILEQATTGSDPGSFLFNEYEKVVNWISRRNQAERELRL